MKTKPTLLLLAGIISLFTTILFVGQYIDPKDGDRAFFIKHRPVFQQYFRSPAAYHRYESVELTLTEKTEESAFQEFIAGTGVLTGNNTFVPAIALIQLTLTLLICGLYLVISKRSIKHWQLASQFLLNIFPTGFAMACICLKDDSTVTLISGLLVVVVNVFIVHLFTLTGITKKQNLVPN